MGFFNNVAANFVQHISIFLEGVGLFLTYVEVKRPDRADQIEKSIDIAYMKCKNHRFVKNLEDEFESLRKNPKELLGVELSDEVPWRFSFVAFIIFVILLFIIGDKQTVSRNLEILSIILFIASFPPCNFFDHVISFYDKPFCGIFSFYYYSSYSFDAIKIYI